MAATRREDGLYYCRHEEGHEGPHRNEHIEPMEWWGDDWQEQKEAGATCAKCNAPIDLEDCAVLVDDVVECADGSTGLVFMAVCEDCEDDD